MGTSSFAVSPGLIPSTSRVRLDQTLQNDIDLEMELCCLNWLDPSKAGLLTATQILVTSLADGGCGKRC